MQIGSIFGLSSEILISAESIGTNTLRSLKGRLLGLLRQTQKQDRRHWSDYPVKEKKFLQRDFVWILWVINQLQYKALRFRT